MNDTSLQKRIDQAWEDSKDWIANFDGTPTITLLVDVPGDSFLSAITTHAGNTENFRISSMAAGQPDAVQFIPLEALPQHLALLQENKIAELSINYAVRSEAFDLDIHMVVYPLKNGKLALELDWWSDQVFSDETDNYAQFRVLGAYFAGLQTLFSSPHLFISPEAGKFASDDTDLWVEI